MVGIGALDNKVEADLRYMRTRCGLSNPGKDDVSEILANNKKKFNAEIKALAAKTSAVEIAGKKVDNDAAHAEKKLAADKEMHESKLQSDEKKAKHEAKTMQAQMAGGPKGPTGQPMKDPVMDQATNSLTKMYKLLKGVTK
jgi:hypothetical protein